MDLLTLPQHHFDHVHGGSVGHAHAAHEFGANAHPVQDLVDLGAAAVNHHRVEADEFQQGHVLGEVFPQLLVHHRVAAVLDHDRHPGDLPDVRQGLDQDVGHTRPGLFLIGSVHSFIPWITVKIAMVITSRPNPTFNKRPHWPKGLHLLACSASCPLRAAPSITASGG